MELDRWPDATSDLSNTIFVASAVAFVMPQEHQPLLTELERVLGARRYNYLVLFLGFIRFAHFWTESHPPLHVEDDSDSLLADQRALAEWVTTYRPRVEGEVAHARAELDELEALRARSRESDQTLAVLREFADSAPSIRRCARLYHPRTMPVIQCSGADGAEWEVFEVARLSDQRDAVRPQLAAGWLCFQRNDGHKVRVARDAYPDNWSLLPTEQLLELMSRGLPSQPSVLPRIKRD